MRTFQKTRVEKDRLLIFIPGHSALVTSVTIEWQRKISDISGS